MFVLTAKPMDQTWSLQIFHQVNISFDIFWVLAHWYAIINITSSFFLSFINERQPCAHALFFMASILPQANCLLIVYHLINLWGDCLFWRLYKKSVVIKFMLTFYWFGFWDYFIQVFLQFLSFKGRGHNYKSTAEECSFWDVF